jgi:hypothetical protein
MIRTAYSLSLPAAKALTLSRSRRTIEKRLNKSGEQQGEIMNRVQEEIVELTTLECVPPGVVPPLGDEGVCYSGLIEGQHEPFICWPGEW